jgi:enoyl-CoA hydratase
MSNIVTYEQQDNVALITLNDGKANAVSPALLEQLNAALDQAEQDKKIVVLAGREGKFSAGFDLNVMSQGGESMAGLVVGGARMAHRMLGFPMPLMVACTGHALAMGGLMLLSADYRIGLEGAFKIGLNEVAIGLTMPYFGVEIARYRLNTAHFGRAVINAEMYSPDDALKAGFLDMVTTAEQLIEQAHAVAARLASINMEAHAATKLRVRQPVLEGIVAGVEKDFGKGAF